MTDTERIDVLESMLAKSTYTGRALLRWSSSGRGMRLLETSEKGSKGSIREAIDDYARKEESKK